MIYLCLRERGKEKEICFFFRRKMPRKGNGSFNQGGGGDEGRMMKQLFFFYAKTETGKDKKQFSIAQSVTQWLFISTTDALIIKSL